jgi:hypothetical protein
MYMKRLAGALCAVVAIGLWLPRAAQAAPVTLRFAIDIDQSCDATDTCQSAALNGGVLSLVFDGNDILYSSGSDFATFSIHATQFGPSAMTVSGGALNDLSNPFGAPTSDSSGSSLSFYEETSGYSQTNAFAGIAQSYEGTVTHPDGSWRDEEWFYTLRILRNAVDPTSGDGITTTPTGADMIAELSRGTFTFEWSSNIFTRECPATGNCVSLSPWVADPRNFYASGIATPLVETTAVPEPATLLLLGTGVFAATVGRTRRAARR